MASLPAMRAAYYSRFGEPADVIEVGERPRPEITADHLLMRVRAAAAGFWDIKQIRGLFGSKFAMPAIPGYEVAGVVERAPEGSEFREGDEVLASPPFPGGAFAEYAVARTNRAARKPDTIDFTAAAALPVAATTAYEGIVDRGRLRSGETVLITAASGGVGSFGVQIAASQGARVFVVAGAASHDLLRELGAAATYDYHDSDWADRARADADGGVDLLFDPAGRETRERAIGAVRGGGRAYFIADEPGELPEGITGEFFSSVPTSARLEAVARLVAAGSVTPAIDAVYTLENTAQALSHVAGRHSRGRVCISVE